MTQFSDDMPLIRLRTRIKVCCIAETGSASLAHHAGADAIGLVSAMPSGPGVITEEMIAKIAKSVSPLLATFLLTSLTDPAAIIAQHRRCRTSAIQLVDAIAPSHYAQLRDQLPGIKLVQVLHVTDQRTIDDALALAPHVDAILLDSGNPNLPTKELGGTGRTHNWQISAEIAGTSPVPVFLAGGLNHTNVAHAIAQVQPYGVDVCSGVRHNDTLHPFLLAAFIHAVRQADADQ